MKILVLNFIMPFVILLVGSMFKKHPVSDMSSQNGYNTPASRKSQAHWDYAQEIAISWINRSALDFNMLFAALIFK